MCPVLFRTAGTGSRLLPVGLLRAVAGGQSATKQRRLMTNTAAVEGWPRGLRRAGYRAMTRDAVPKPERCAACVLVIGRADRITSVRVAYDVTKGTMEGTAFRGLHTVLALGHVSGDALRSLGVAIFEAQEVGGVVPGGRKSWPGPHYSAKCCGVASRRA